MIDINKSCRLCLSTKLTFNIHTSKKYINADLPPLDEIIKELTTVQIEKRKSEANISNNICFTCNYLLIRFHAFRQQSIISDKKFKEAVKEIEKNASARSSDISTSSSESKNCMFADSLVPLYARSILLSENKRIYTKDSHDLTDTPSINTQNSISKFLRVEDLLPSRHTIPDLALDLTNFNICDGNDNNFDYCIRTRRHSNQSSNSYHPSVKQIIKENPKIIIPQNVTGYNYNCNVIVQSFQQLFREALSSRAKKSNQSRGKLINRHVRSNNSLESAIADNDAAKKPVSIMQNSGLISTPALLEKTSNSTDTRHKSPVNACSSFDTFNDKASEKITNEECAVCRRHFPSVILLKDHMTYCHMTKKSEAVVFAQPLIFPSGCKADNLKYIKLIDNEERIQLQYSCVRKTIRLPKLIKKRQTHSVSNNSITLETLSNTEGDELKKTKKPSIADNSITFKTLNVTESDELWRKLLGDTKYQNDPNITDISIPSPKVLETSQAAATSTFISPIYDFEAHRQKMLKSSVCIREDKHENAEVSNVPDANLLLCQEYLPLNRPVNNSTIVNSIASVSENLPLPLPVSFASTQELVLPAPIEGAQEVVLPVPHIPRTQEIVLPAPMMMQETVVTKEMFQPNFYVDTTNPTLPITSVKKLKRKNTEISPTNVAKRSKPLKSCTKRIFKEIQSKNILDKLFAPQLDLEEILRNDFSESNFNEIDTSLINSSVCAYLRKNPRYFNLLEQLVGIRDIPVEMNVTAGRNTNFEFIKTKHNDAIITDSNFGPSLTCINWRNTSISQNYIPNKNHVKISGKIKQKKEICVPLSNWKQCSLQSSLNDELMESSCARTIDCEQLQDNSSITVPNVSGNKDMVDDFGNLSNTSCMSTNITINTDAYPTNTKTRKKQIPKIIFKRSLFSANGTSPAKYVVSQVPADKNAVSKPSFIFTLKEQISKKLILPRNPQIGNKSDITKRKSKPVSILKQLSTDNNSEVIEIDDDNDTIKLNKHAVINAEPGPLQIVSVMSLNDEYNNSIEKNIPSAIGYTTNVTKNKEVLCIPHSNENVMTPVRLSNDECNLDIRVENTDHTDSLRETLSHVQVNSEVAGETSSPKPLKQYFPVRSVKTLSGGYTNVNLNMPEATLTFETSTQLRSVNPVTGICSDVPSSVPVATSKSGKSNQYSELISKETNSFENLNVPHTKKLYDNDIQQSQDHENGSKPLNISVLSPTRINLLLTNKKLQV